MFAYLFPKNVSFEGFEPMRLKEMFLNSKSALWYSTQDKHLSTAPRRELTPGVVPVVCIRACQVKYRSVQWDSSSAILLKSKCQMKVDIKHGGTYT